MTGIKWQFVGGFIEYYSLEDWWLVDLSVEERRAITDACLPYSDRLVGAKIRYSSDSKLSFLQTLANWTGKRKETRIAAYKAADQAVKYWDEASDVDKHFALSGRCKLYYRWRDVDDGALDVAIDACEKSVAMSGRLDPYRLVTDVKLDMPAQHHCFKQLCIIEAKRGNHRRVVDLCNLAEAEGWGGDWEKRKNRAKRMISKDI